MWKAFGSRKPLCYVLLLRGVSHGAGDCLGALCESHKSRRFREGGGGGILKRGGRGRRAAETEAVDTPRRPFRRGSNGEGLY